jgi:hypothetical protein
MSSGSDVSEDGWTMCRKDESGNSVSQYVFFLSRYGPTQLIQFGFDKPVTDVSADPFRDVKRIIFFIPGKLLLACHELQITHDSAGNPGAISMYRSALVHPKDVQHVLTDILLQAFPDTIT